MSAATGYSIFLSATVWAIFSDPSVWQTPMMTRPWSLYFAWRSFVWGIEAMHGPHHVAQKSRSTTLPFMSPSVVAGPLIQFSTASAGGALPSRPANRSRDFGSPSRHSSFTASAAGAASRTVDAFTAAGAAAGAVGAGSARSFSTTASTWSGLSPSARRLPARSTTPYVGHHITRHALADSSVASFAIG